ncbi:uncharacterized protein LOC105698423 [Orussus abietinus]|uniref:uncharacterized protein LOC105698423 n=1 Tax=Orussus abietinus TaxID=222816 RepID=UPI000C71618C|nr:uncharacterized protein LOC105698423 [Orussus abietinus]
MSWIRDSTLNWLQCIAIKVLKTGKVPKHVAFIMDGNRRYASKKKVDKVEGHTKGFDKLTETLQWCFDLGIPEVTVYAFSIENFKRNKEEIDGIMELAKQKFQRLLDERDKLMEHGIHIRVIGNLSLIPMDIRKLIAEAMLITRHNNKVFLNVAFAYTSRDEITQAVKNVVEGVKNADILVDDINEELLSKSLYTGDLPEPDLLIRTSGEVRFSDFLLWQTAKCYVYFSDVLWPEFTGWDLLTAVFYYQRCYSDLQEIVKVQETNVKTNDDRISTYIAKLNRDRLRLLQRISSTDIFLSILNRQSFDTIVYGHPYKLNMADRSSSDSQRRRKRNRERHDYPDRDDTQYHAKRKNDRTSPRRDDRSSRNRDYDSRSKRNKDENSRNKDFRREKDKSNDRNRFSEVKVKKEPSPEWGKSNSKEQSKNKPQEKEKPNYELSGKLTEDANTVNGVVIKYAEPQDARKPKRRWRLYPFKGEKALPTLYVHRQSAYLMGRDRKVADIPLDHPSCSKQHAALQFRLVPFQRDGGGEGRRVRPYLIDLESANGTFVNNVKLEPRRYHELLERDVIRFGFSSREYVLLHEQSRDDALDDDVPLATNTTQ